MFGIVQNAPIQPMQPVPGGMLTVCLANRQHCTFANVGELSRLNIFTRAWEQKKRSNDIFAEIGHKLNPKSRNLMIKT